MSEALCPCCSNSLLRHIRSSGVYWYCRHCHEEMPNLVQRQNQSHLFSRSLLELSRSNQRLYTKWANSDNLLNSVGSAS